MPKFDVVIGNPPFQDNTKKAKNSNLWTKFVILSFNITKDNGFLSLITPDTWFAPTETQFKIIKNIFKNNELICINKNIKKYFEGIGSSFVSFVLRKNKNILLTSIELEDGTKINKNIQNYILLPKIMNILSLSIIEKILLNNHEKIKFSSGLRSEESRFLNEGNFKMIAAKGEIVNVPKPAKNTNIKKVVVSKISYLYPIYDNGEACTSSYSYWAPVNNEIEGNNLINFLNSKMINLIVNKLCRYTGFNSLGVLKQLPILDFSHNWSNEELYKYFNLTNEEINYIEFYG